MTPRAGARTPEPGDAVESDERGGRPARARLRHCDRNAGPEVVELEVESDPAAIVQRAPVRQMLAALGRQAQLEHAAPEQRVAHAQQLHQPGGVVIEEDPVIALRAAATGEIGAEHDLSGVVEGEALEEVEGPVAVGRLLAGADDRDERAPPASRRKIPSVKLPTPARNATCPAPLTSGKETPPKVPPPGAGSPVRAISDRGPPSPTNTPCPMKPATLLKRPATNAIWPESLSDGV